MVKMRIELQNKREIEHFLSIVQVGFLYCLKKKVLDIEEAEGYLFYLGVVDLLEELGIDDEVTDVIRLGCELEDVESLVPEKLSDNIKSLMEDAIQNIKRLPKPDFPIETKIE